MGRNPTFLNEKVICLSYYFSLWFIFSLDLFQKQYKAFQPKREPTIKKTTSKATQLPHYMDETKISKRSLFDSTRDMQH